MSDVAITSLDSQSKIDKHVIVRVKRKVNQSPLEAIWLEINERPLKRRLLDFQNLSISDSSTKDATEESRAKKVLVHHVETIINSDLKVDFLQSFMPYSSEAKLKKLGERKSIKADNKQDRLLAKAINDRQVLSKTARFEQIWRSRTKSEVVHEICHLYDVVRIDVEENRNDKEEDPDLEVLMASYLPLLKKFVPDGAVEVETVIHDYISKKASKNDYVYDFYAVKDDDIKITQDDESFPFPLVLQVVEDDEFYDDPYDSDDESYDSNAEDNQANDYPEEEDSDYKSDDDNGWPDSEDMEPRNVVAPHVKDADLIYYEDDYY